MRIRVRFSKVGKVRFLSHRDLARIWERALRRTDVPVAYSVGFVPRPRLHFGLALATGAESWAEYLDIDIDPDRVDQLAPLDELAVKLGDALPVGVEVLAIGPVVPGSPSLQESVTSCGWSIAFAELPPDLAASAVERALAASELPVTRERKGRPVTDDLRPQLRYLQALSGAVHPVNPEDPWATAPGDEAGSTIVAELGTQPCTVRPSELVAVLDPGTTWPDGRVRRLYQWIAHEDGRREPLVAPPSPWARTEVRAS